MISIQSPSGAVKLTEALCAAVKSVARRQPIGSGSGGDDEVDRLPVPFAVFKFVEGAEVTLDVETLADNGEHDQDNDHESKAKATWESLVASLPREGCRMAAVQVPWRAHSDNVVRYRLVFVLWTPTHGTTVKQRMVASMSSKGVERAIEQWVGPAVRIEAGSVDGLELSLVQEKIRSKATVK
jgi:hypothetical protein